jgi:flagellar hook-length control protein FliK
MLHATQLIDINIDAAKIKSTKKDTQIERMDFACLLNSQTTSDSTQQSQNDHQTNSVNDRADEKLNARENRNTTQSCDDNEMTNKNNNCSSDEAKYHSRKNGPAESEQNSSHYSDSGTEETSDSALSVDGREKGIQPGASTEAAVNAPSSSTLSAEIGSVPTTETPQADPQLSGILAQTMETLANITANSSGDDQINTNIDSASPNMDDFQNLIRQLITNANNSSASNIQDQNTELKITAKNIDKTSHLLQGNLNSNNQNIMFDTGLAEHFVRLLTDQFDQLKNPSTYDSDTKNMDNSTTQNMQTPTTATSTTGLSINTTATPHATTTTNPASESFFAASQSALTPDVDTSSNLDRLVQVLRSNLGQRQSQITVRLDPPDLGKMKVDVKLVNNNLNLSIVTETKEAAETLTNRMDTLKQNLEQNGISLGKVEVVSHSNNSSHAQNQNWQQDGHSQNHNGFSFQQHNQNPSQNSDSENLTTSDTETIDSTTEPVKTFANAQVNLVA